MVSKLAIWELANKGSQPLFLNAFNLINLRYCQFPLAINIQYFQTALYSYDFQVKLQDWLEKPTIFWIKMPFLSKKEKNQEKWT